MGDYNPHRPYIIGQELVPIQESTLEFNPFAYTSERGYIFPSLTDIAQINTGYMYLRDFPQATARNRMFTMNVYQAAALNRAGTVQSVIVPVSAVTMRGIGTLKPWIGETLYNGDAVAAVQAISDPSDVNSYLSIDGATTSGSIRYQFNFGVNGFENLLRGKRILGVDIIQDQRFSNGWKALTANQNEFIGDAELWLSTNSMYSGDPEPGYVRYATVANPYTEDSYTTEVRRKRTRLGDICPIPLNSVGGWSAYSSYMQSWNYDSLSRFTITTGTGNEIWLLLYAQQGSNIYNWNLNLYYMAMEIFYCDETRVMTGTRRFNGPFDPATQWVLFQQGINDILLMQPSYNGQPGPSSPTLSLLQDTYAVTIAESNGGDAYTSLAQPNGLAPLNQLRIMEPLPTYSGVLNTLPYPLDENVGDDALVSTDSLYVPQLSLGLAQSSQLTVSYPYGRQATGYCYSTFTVEQDIDLVISSIVPPEGGPRYYDWIRFYARNTGAVTPLTVTWKQTGLPIANITPAQFNALPKLTTDGWREVTLQLSPSVTATYSGNLTVVWSAPLEHAGSRWEILGAAAPAVSGTEYSRRGGQTFNQAPPPLQLGPATYGGSSKAMKWMPQLGPYVSAPAVDTNSDAAVMLAVTPPAVSGFALSMLSQPLTGIGTSCLDYPCGMPTGLYYNHLTWNLPTATTQARDRFNRTSPSTFVFPVGPTQQTFGTPTYGPAWLRNRNAQSMGVSNGNGYILLNSNVSQSQFLPLTTSGGLSTPSTSTGRCYTPDAADIHLTGDQALLWYGRLEGYSTGSDQTLIGRWNTTGNQRSIRLVLATNGVLRLEWSTNGTTVTSAPTPASITNATASNNGTVGLRVLLDVDNGAGGYTVTFQKSHEGSALLDPFSVNAISWTTIATVTTGAGTTSVFSGSADLEIGAANAGTVDRAIGVHYMGGLNNAAGTLVRFVPLMKANPGDTVILDSVSAAIWNVTGNDAIVASVGLVRNIDATFTLGLDEYQGFTTTAGANQYYWRIYIGEVPGDLGTTNVVQSGLQDNNANAITVLLAVSNPAAGGSPTGTLRVGQGAVLDSLVHVDLSWMDIFTWNSRVRMRVLLDNGRLMVKVWNPLVDEPLQWAVDSSGYPTFIAPYPNDFGFGIQFFNSTLITPIASVSDLQITPPQLQFGYYEIQRSDDVDSTWQTICKNTNPASNSFNDYEARTGVNSYYRIRTVDVYGFTGNWSSTISGNIPSPGVTGGACLAQDGAHVLIFTSNENQDGAHSLAYSSVWEGEQVSEDLSFPESSFVQLQAMYNRNFYVAFRPMERSGEQFTRNVLVQAAAIPPASLDGFDALTDMGWDDVNYVCVRDEDGNRWFASVTVPNGSVRNRRTLYMAEVNIAEVTDTPTPVDAPWNP